MKIGDTFKTPLGGTLKVVNLLGKGFCEVVCNKCHKDSELWKYPLKISYSNLKKGSCPCGCTKGSVRWTSEQYEVLVRRQCNGTQYTFIGFTQDKVKSSTKIILYCNIHSKLLQNTTLSNFLRGKGGCIECKLDSIRAHAKLNNLEFLTSNLRYMFSGKYTDFRLVENTSNEVEVYCSECSKDEYTLNSLCTGWFKTHIDRLKVGKEPCRCNKYAVLTKEQMEFKITKFLAGGKLIRWLDTDFKTTSTIEVQCANGHNHYKTTVEKLLNGEKTCPECRDIPIKFAYIDSVREVNNEVCLKFGITKDVDQRLYLLNKNNKGFLLDSLIKFEFHSEQACRDAEMECKRLHYSKFFSKNEFPDGFTETAKISDYDKICTIFKNFGGVEFI